MCVGETERAFFHMAITLKILKFLKKLFNISERSTSVPNLKNFFEKVV